MGAFLLLVISISCAMVVLMFVEDPDWQARRNITRLAKESLKRERHPKPRRGYRYVYAGYSAKRR